MAFLITLKAWDSCRIRFSGSNIPSLLIYQAFDLMSVLMVGMPGPQPCAGRSHTTGLLPFLKSWGDAAAPALPGWAEEVLGSRGPRCPFVYYYFIVLFCIPPTQPPVHRSLFLYWLHMSAPFYPSRERQNIREGLEAWDGQLIHPQLELIVGRCAIVPGPVLGSWAVGFQFVGA